MVFAQVKDGVVRNTIVLDDMSLAPLFQEGFDYFLRVDNIDPQPSKGWFYNGQDFEAPPEPPAPEEPEEEE